MSEESKQYGDKRLLYREAAEALLSDDSVKPWIKEAIKSLDQTDLDTALREAAIILKLQKMRKEEERVNKPQ